MAIKTKPCPACGNELSCPRDYLNSFKALGEHIDSFIPVLEKDFAVTALEPFGGLSKQEYRKWFVENIEWSKLSEHDRTMLQKIDKVLCKLYDIAYT